MNRNQWFLDDRLTGYQTKIKKVKVGWMPMLRKVIVMRQSLDWCCENCEISRFSYVCLQILRKKNKSHPWYAREFVTKVILLITHVIQKITKPTIKTQRPLGCVLTVLSTRNTSLALIVREKHIAGVSERFPQTLPARFA